MADDNSFHKQSNFNYFHVNPYFGNIQVDPQISTAPEGVYSLNVFAKENSNEKIFSLYKQVYFFKSYLKIFFKTSFKHF